MEKRTRMGCIWMIVRIGPEDGVTVPMRYVASEGVFTLGEASGAIVGSVRIEVRFVKRDGTQRAKSVCYDGSEVQIACADVESVPTRPFWKH